MWGNSGTPVVLVLHTCQKGERRRCRLECPYCKKISVETVSDIQYQFYLYFDIFDNTKANNCWWCILKPPLQTLVDVALEENVLKHVQAFWIFVSLCVSLLEAHTPPCTRMRPRLADVVGARRGEVRRVGVGLFGFRAGASWSFVSHALCLCVYS